jgi:aryl-alcohol dehydrogenase-like predicted oxidoreductase
MKFRRLGNTGLHVSELCLGTMTFGTGFFGIGQVDQAGADQLVNKSVDAGVNFFDTADIYSQGESESILGKALANVGAPRDSLVIATKVRGPMSDAAGAGTGDVNNVGLSRKHILESCDRSLKRLGTDYIDLYQIHSFDSLTPLEETMGALDDLVRAGKVRYIGCSNLMARHVMKANAIADSRHASRFVSLQAYYTLVGRDLELELLPLCREEGLGVMVWSPLAGGFLTGKFRRDSEKPENSRRADFDFPPIDVERAYDVVDALDTMAKEKDSTIAQLALAWLLHQSGVTSVVIGAKKMSQLEDNLGATQVKFTDAELERLQSIAPPPAIYPTWMIGRPARKPPAES